MFRFKKLIVSGPASVRLFRPVPGKEARLRWRRKSAAENGCGVSKKNKNKQPAAVWLYRHTMKSDAWQALSVGARSTYVELAANYNTNMQNAVYLSIRTGAKKLNVDKKTVIRWLHELEHYGFIVMVQRGTIGVYGYGRATQYRLTDRPYAGSPPTFDFKNWTGEIFDPKKQNPGPLAGPHRSTGRTITKSVPANSLWSAGRTIRTAPDRSTGRTITSVASYEASKAGAAAELVLTGLLEWTTPTLTEIEYTGELRRLYRCEMTPETVPAIDLLKLSRGVVATSCIDLSLAKRSN